MKIFRKPCNGVVVDDGSPYNVKTMRFHEKLRELGAAHTDEALARIVTTSAEEEISDSTVRRWRNGIGKLPRLNHAWIIAKTLGVSLDFLADDDRDIDERTNPTWIAMAELVRRLGPDEAVRRLSMDSSPKPRDKRKTGIAAENYDPKTGQPLGPGVRRKAK